MDRVAAVHGDRQLLGRDDLVLGLSVLLQLYNVAALHQGDRDVVIVVCGHILKSVEGHLIAYRRIGHRNMNSIGPRRKRIAPALTNEINDIVLRIQGIPRQLAVGGVALIRVQSDASGNAAILRTNRYHKNAGVLRPNGSEEGASISHIDIDRVIGDKDDGRSLALCGEQPSVGHFHHTGICLAVHIQNGIVIIGLDEIVIHRIIYCFPVAQVHQLIGVPCLSQFQIALGVDVQIDIGHIVAVVALYIMVNGRLIFSLGLKVLFRDGHTPIGSFFKGPGIGDVVLAADSIIISFVVR